MAIQKSKRLQPLHPGEVLKELLTDAGLTVNALALALRVPANRIGGIVKGQRGITGDTSLRLARYFGTSAQMWMNLQAKYDLAVAEDEAASRIKKEVHPARFPQHRMGDHKRRKSDIPDYGTARAGFEPVMRWSDVWHVSRLGSTGLE